MAHRARGLRGDAPGALAWDHEAFFRCDEDDMAGMFGRKRVARDLLLARYAILLAEAHESDAAAGILALLESSEPVTLGLSVAKTALGSQLAALPVSASRVFTVTLHMGAGPAWDHDVGVFLVGDPDDPPSARILACSVSRWPERRADHRLVPDCITDLEIVDPGDPRVAPLLQAWLDGQLGSK